MTKTIAVYEGYGARKRLAYLQNAYNISFTKTTTALWTGSFSLPYSDPKTKYCQAFNLVDIWDIDASGEDKYIGLFRISPRTESTLGTDANIEYKLEHVLSTLLDDTMIGYHEFGNAGVYTANSIGYILSNQSEKRWSLGQCDYAHQYLYGWQDENLLSALFSITQPFEETDYYWDFETRGYPWILNLRKTNKTPVTDIRYKKNLNGLIRTVDPSNLTTRLYCYGYGDGDNTLGISEVNNGLPYIQSPNVEQYGVITQTWTDERFTIAESLLANGRALLASLDHPVVTYDIDIQTIYAAGDLDIGDTIRVVSEDLDELMIVKDISKDDVTGAPKAGKVVLGQGTIDISSSLADLAERQRISETYSQGSESMIMDSFADNASTEYPVEFPFTIPDNVVHVNEILFSCDLKNFRAYSRAVDGGGNGGNTTLAGGVTVDSVSSGSVNRATLGAAFTNTKVQGRTPEASTAVWEGWDTMTSDILEPKADDATPQYEIGGIKNVLADTVDPDHLILHNHGIPVYDDPINGGLGVVMVPTTPDGRGTLVGEFDPSTSGFIGVITEGKSTFDEGRVFGTVGGGATYLVDPNGDLIAKDPNTGVLLVSPWEPDPLYNIPRGLFGTLNISVASSGVLNSGNHVHIVSKNDLKHGHLVSVPPHKHNVPGVDHEHPIKDFMHTHPLNIDQHTHKVRLQNHAHSWVLPNHTHNLRFGIYTGPIANGMEIYLDDLLVGSYPNSRSVSNVNLIPHMSKKANGEIYRGRHIIRIVPIGGGIPYRPAVEGIPGIPGSPGEPEIPGVPAIPAIEATETSPYIPEQPAIPPVPAIPPTDDIPGTPGEPEQEAIPGLTRVEANFIIRLFTNMRDGRQY